MTTPPKHRRILIGTTMPTRILTKFNAFQQRNAFFGLPIAITKKFIDDRAYYLAALTTYYAFISLFPLLIVATALAQLLSTNNSSLKSQILEYATSYFPAIGNTLADSVNAPSGSGISLFIGLLITLYGARGIANVAQTTLNIIWSVPRKQQLTFPKNTIKSFGMIFSAGAGFIIASALIGYATAAGHSPLVGLVLGSGGFAVLFTVFLGIFTFGPADKKSVRFHIPGALFAAVGLLIVQALSGYIIARHLKGLAGLNAQLSLVLALLFVLYLQTLLFVIAAELNSVRALKLWPRSIDPKKRLPADDKAYSVYKNRETYI